MTYATPSSFKRQTWRTLLTALFLCGAVIASAAEKVQPAEIKVGGLGPWGNFDMRRSLSRLLGEERGATLSANAIEDAMFLLMSAVQDDGYLKVVINVTVVAPDGQRTQFRLDETMSVGIPRETVASRVEFEVERGVRYYLADVKFVGLTAIDEKVALGYFVGESTLINNKAVKLYTPSRLTRSVDSLMADLRQRGFAEADVRAGDVQIDHATGEVRAVIEVREGSRLRVAAVNIEGGAETGVTVSITRQIGGVWSESVQQDIAAEIRRAFYAKGYPDVAVRMSRQVRDPVVEASTAPEAAAPGFWKDVTVTARVTPGEFVVLGPIRYRNEGGTRLSVIQRRVHVKEGDPLDVNEIEQTRYRISRLGVFDRVDVRFDTDEGPVRSPVFVLEPGRLMEVNLLAGYGTYEQARVGVELRQYDLFGLAHQARGILVESMKSTRGEYAYTVPELFGESIDGTAKIFGLQREEIAFQRQEYGGSIILGAPVPWLGARGTAAYTFQALRNRDNQLQTSGVDNKQEIVASVDLGLTRDRRDNPLSPQKGYHWFAQLETASKKLGGSVEYQRLEFGGSYHTGWGSGRWIHLGASHGVVTTYGSKTDELLPVNKRFYPGGDGSNRGYQTGEAAPRGADGKFIGAKTYFNFSADLEQALFGKWTAVLFGDMVGTSTQLRHYPFDETLYAAGLGLRYRTLIGPVRVEYGRNLNPRVGDPGGTWLISIGFPF